MPLVHLLQILTINYLKFSFLLLLIVCFLNMSRKHAQQLDLEIEIDVLTRGALVEIVNSILEFLLFQRNQIEFVYKTFREFVNEWTCEAGKAMANTSVNAYMLERQRKKALQTKESICKMRELIANAFEKHMVKSLRFIFGSTTFTAKEAYTIHIPFDSVSSAHHHDHHRLPKMGVNQLFLTLLTKEDLYDVFSKNLRPTNLHLELETLEKIYDPPTPSSISRLYRKQITKLPSSCKDIHFHLRHKVPTNFNTAILNCCKELSIFEESLHAEESFDKNNSRNIFPENDFMTNWWETDVIVRGFKEQLIKGKSIWTKCHFSTNF